MQFNGKMPCTKHTGGGKEVGGIMHYVRAHTILTAVASNNDISGKSRDNDGRNDHICKEWVKD